MIKLSKHCIDRIDERFKTNHYAPEEYILNTFKKVYKETSKGKIFPKIEKTSNDYGEVIKLYWKEFKFIYNKQQGDVILITFGFRTPKI